MNEGYRDTGTIPVRTMEECSELIKAICKAERFGYLNWHPDNPERTNADDILSEISDVEIRCSQMKAFIAEIREASE